MCACAGESRSAVAEVVSSEEGLQVESASRLEWDRTRLMLGQLDTDTDPVKADAEFMRCMLELLRKASFPHSGSMHQ